MTGAPQKPTGTASLLQEDCPWLSSPWPQDENTRFGDTLSKQGTQLLAIGATEAQREEIGHDLLFTQRDLRLPIQFQAIPFNTNPPFQRILWRWWIA